jgi:threonine dehydrogenase-like Zn-dependent dehydrogenase
LKGKKIVFTGTRKAELVDFEIDEKLKPHQILFKTKYSLICAGTELSVWGINESLSGVDLKAKYPAGTGYTGVSEILKVGESVTNFQEGDHIFTYGGAHSSISKMHSLREGIPYIKVPEKLDLKFAPFARIAAISMTSLRVSNGELGDFVAIQGLGLVGNMAAQLFNLSGLQIIGIDGSDGRLKIAKKCGITKLVNPLKEELKEKVMEMTKGLGCEVSVDAIGNPRLIKNLCEVTGSLGEVILLGSPRGKYETDVTAFLNCVHLWPKGCLTFKGAHEWRFPLFKKEGSKHSIERNVEVVFNLMSEGRLKINPVITHVLSPEECEDAYLGLLDKKDEYLGVLFDWSNY